VVVVLLLLLLLLLLLVMVLLALYTPHCRLLAEPHAPRRGQHHCRPSVHTY